MYLRPAAEKSKRPPSSVLGLLVQNKYDAVMPSIRLRVVMAICAPLCCQCHILNTGSATGERREVGLNSLNPLYIRRIKPKGTSSLKVFLKELKGFNAFHLRSGLQTRALVTSATRTRRHRVGGWGSIYGNPSSCFVTKLICFSIFLPCVSHFPDELWCVGPQFATRTRENPVNAS